MKNLIILCVLMVLSFTAAYPQTIQQEINNQVWKPFIKSFNERDDAGFEAVHSEDIIRVVRDSKQIFGADVYFKPRPDSVKTKWSVWKRTLELRFIERIASADKAFEIGYYKTSSTNTDTGEERVNYGKFHVLLRKEDGNWKLLMDADGNEGVDETIFQEADPM